MDISSNNNTDVITMDINVIFNYVFGWTGERNSHYMTGTHIKRVYVWNSSRFTGGRWVSTLPLNVLALSVIESKNIFNRKEKQIFIVVDSELW